MGIVLPSHADFLKTQGGVARVDRFGMIQVDYEGAIALHGLPPRRIALGLLHALDLLRKEYHLRRHFTITAGRGGDVAHDGLAAPLGCVRQKPAHSLLVGVGYLYLVGTGGHNGDVGIKVCDDPNRSINRNGKGRVGGSHGPVHFLQLCRQLPVSVDRFVNLVKHPVPLSAQGLEIPGSPLYPLQCIALSHWSPLVSRGFSKSKDRPFLRRSFSIPLVQLSPVGVDPALARLQGIASGCDSKVPPTQAIIKVRAQPIEGRPLMVELREEWAAFDGLGTYFDD